MLTCFSYYIIEFHSLPRPLVKVVAALLCAFTYLTGYKPVACYKLLCPQASAHRRCATHPYTSKNQCATIAEQVETDCSTCRQKEYSTLCLI